MRLHDIDGYALARQTVDDAMMRWLAEPEFATLRHDDASMPPSNRFTGLF